MKPLLQASLWVGLVALAAWEDHRAQPYRRGPPIEILRGVTYECARLAPRRDGKGLAHIVRVDLSEPGVELYLTPVDPAAATHGHQYRLAHARSVARDEKLSVLVNGTLFRSSSFLLPMVGDWASAAETVVADEQANHVDPNSYLLWFAPDLTPRVEPTKPPPSAALQRAVWGIAGQSVVLRDGQAKRRSDTTCDRRTLAAVDPQRKLLWLAVFESVTYSRAAAMLARRGAADGIVLDGGDSSTMWIAPPAGVDPRGTLFGGRRPVATFFGVKADPL